MTTPQKPEKSESDNNDLRLLAHDIIFKLFKAKGLSHLRLLKAHCNSSIMEIEADIEMESEDSHLATEQEVDDDNR